MRRCALPLATGGATARSTTACARNYATLIRMGPIHQTNSQWIRIRNSCARLISRTSRDRFARGLDVHGGSRALAVDAGARRRWRQRHHVDELSLPPTYMLLVHASTYNHVDTLNWIWQASVADPASVGPQTIHISRATRHTVLPWWLDLHDTHDHRIAFPSFTWQLDVNDPCEDVQAFWDLQSRPCARAGASDKCAIRIQLSRHFHGSPDLRLFDWLQQHGQIGTDTRSIHDGLVKTFKSAWQRRRFDALDAIMARGFGQFRNLTFMVTLSNCLQTAAANNDTELLR